MANIDEELQEHSDKDFQDVDQTPEVDQDQEEIDEEQRRQQEFEAQRQRQRVSQRKSQAQQVVNTAQSVQKWYKRYRKTVIVLEILGATAPIWGTLLLVLFIAGAFVGGCNGSTTFRIASLGACEPFIVGSSNTGSRSGGGGAGGSFGSNDAENRALLARYGITVNKANCTSPTQTDCTSLDNMNQATLNEIISLAQACDDQINPTDPPDNACGVRVTGGTEAGHEAGTCSHANGYKFDIGLNNQVNAFVRSFTPMANRGSDNAPQFRAPDGSVYAQEGDHWDVVVGCA